MSFFFVDRGAANRSTADVEVGFLRKRVRIAAVSDLPAFRDMIDLDMLPVVVGKPSTVDSSNAKALTVGSIGSITQVGDALYANALLTDGQAIDLVKSGSRFELVYRKSSSGAVVGRYVAIVPPIVPDSRPAAAREVWDSFYYGDNATKRRDGR